MEQEEINLTWSFPYCRARTSWLASLRAGSAGSIQYYFDTIIVAYTYS